MNGDRARIAAALHGVVSELERELVRAFGFTVLTAELVEIGPDGEIRVRGTALVPRISTLLRRRLCERLSTERVRCELAPLPGAGWFRVRDFPARLFRELDTGTERSLASELLSGDGPVERLARHGASTLVRDMCGTIGWVDEPLVGPCEPPQIAAAHGRVEELVAELREYLGVHYLLGGTTRAGIDCSGLVQRGARDALGLLLPRHSSDQRAFVAAGSAPLAPGDLAFTWTERDGACHVGVVTEAQGPPDDGVGGACVIHASLSRRRVVEEPLSAFTAGATRVEYARYSALLLRHAEHVGAAQIMLKA